MSIIAEERLSDSPYIETITHGYTASDGSTIRPAESHWHMVLVKQCGKARAIVVGPWTTAGIASYAEGAEILWIKFKLGTFMPALPTRNFLNVETVLPEAANRSFWLQGSRWQFPDFENADTFVNRLARNEVLSRDPMVNAVLEEDQPQAYSSRTIRHRFLRATGMPQGHIHQVERAQRAAALLRQGVPIADTIFEAGYFDQPHLTRSLKQWVGHTPAQLIRQHTSH
jgi:hypothetical protein